MARARTDVNWDAVKVIWLGGQHTSEEPVSLRYHLGDRAEKKVNKLADELAFANRIREYVTHQSAKMSIALIGLAKRPVLDPQNLQKVSNSYE